MPPADPAAAKDGLGRVYTRSIELFSAQRPLVLTSGRRLGPIQVAYETYGELDELGSNAVMVCHALTGDAHAAGHHGDPNRRGWWDSIIGPGRPLDTDRFFVVCANLLGGCQGSTGPSSVDPATGRPYGLTFPLVSVTDMVEVHRELMRALGVSRLMAVVGGSLGGMQALDWALRAPEEISSAVVVAASSRLTAQNIAFSAVAREAIMRDPHFHGGDYLQHGSGPDVGMAVARMMAHITYLSEAGLDEKFGRRIQDADEPRFGFDTDFEVESYLKHQGETFLDRFDALSYLYLSRSLDYFDPFGHPQAEQQLRALAAARRPVLAVSFDTDWRFDTRHSLRLVRRLEDRGVPVTFREVSSPWGHDSFLLHVPEYHRIVSTFLDRVHRVAALRSGTATTAGRRPPVVEQRSEPAASAPDLPPRVGDLRSDQQVLVELVEPETRVLDVGCGDGALLHYLIGRQNCRGTGIEERPERVLESVRRGVPVLSLDMDTGPAELSPDSYDLVVMSQTLQMTRSPLDVLREVSRVARTAVVSVPNFGLWRHRAALLLRGRMPVSEDLPFEWFQTPNIHLSTLRDVEDLFTQAGWVIARREALDARHRPLRVGPANVLASAAVYRLERRGGAGQASARRPAGTAVR
jgi:homoserine O-acetyltransferase